MLLPRLLTAIVGIPLVVFLLNYGGLVFALAVAIFSFVATVELNNMAKKIGAQIYLFSGMICVPILCLVAYFFGAEKLMLAFNAFILFVLIEGIIKFKNSKWLQCNFFSIFALCYTGLFFAQIILIRQFAQTNIVENYFGKMSLGEIFLWLGLLGTWSSDTFAYFVGITIGKHKMCPQLSPKKSWEGAIGGFVGCVASVYFLGTYLFNLGIYNLVFLGLIIAVVAPLGDLCESQLKRFCSVKDSGSIFPGHGGVLDRFDSILFVMPAVYIYLILMVG